jgi:RNA polymerase sporulation-specific sigma factor
MSKKSVEITGLSTANIKILSDEEQNILFAKMKKNDMKAREELINGNLRLVLSILKKFNGRVENMDDLFQIGCIGLVKAIDNFDPSYNVKLSTYAVPMILGEIKRYIRDNSILRISRSVKDLSYKIIKFKDEYTILNGAEPTLKQIADEFSVNEIDISNALQSLNEPVSIFEPIYNDGGETIYLFDQIEDIKSSKNTEELLNLKKALLEIKNRERKILLSRFLYGKTQIELASEFNISQAQVSRLEKNAIKNVKKLMK